MRIWIEIGDATVVKFIIVVVAVSVAWLAKDMIEIFRSRKKFKSPADAMVDTLRGIDG